MENAESVIKPEGRVWFTADTHYGHQNIIFYCNRPFTNAQKMEQVMIARYRDVVKQEDTVYFLGDFLADFFLV